MDTMNVEVTETVLGNFVPRFLLKFQGDANLQNYYRKVLKTNYQKGVVQLEFGHCQICCSTLTYNDKPRMKPSQPKTKKLSKILAKYAKKQNLGRYQTYLVEKFLKSSTQLIVRCPSCDFVNKRPVATNETKLAVKEKLLHMSRAVIEPDVSSITKKKKKKKKKKKQTDDNSGLIIPHSMSDQGSTIADEVISSPMNISSLSPGLPARFSTPAPVKVQESNLARSVSTKTPSRSAHSQKSTFSTPKDVCQFGPMSNKNQMVFQKKSGNAQSTPYGNKKMKHKHLQKFLSQELTATTKPASLTDFLSSL